MTREPRGFALRNLCGRGAPLLAALWLAACNYRTYPASASLCPQPEPAPGWRGNVYSQPNERFGSIEYFLSVADAPAPGARDARVYPVAVGGMSGGQHATPPRPAFAMEYRPADAWVEIDGRRIAADPILYDADPLKAHTPGSPLAHLPVDLNAPAGTAPTLEPHVFVVFPVAPPRLESTWRLHLGTIRLDGQQVPLPEYKSCFRPSHTESAAPWQG